MYGFEVNSSYSPPTFCFFFSLNWATFDFYFSFSQNRVNNRVWHTFCSIKSNQGKSSQVNDKMTLIICRQIDLWLTTATLCFKFILKRVRRWRRRRNRKKHSKFEIRQPNDQKWVVSNWILSFNNAKCQYYPIKDLIDDVSICRILWQFLLWGQTYSFHTWCMFGKEVEQNLIHFTLEYVSWTFFYWVRAICNRNWKQLLFVFLRMETKKNKENERRKQKRERGTYNIRRMNENNGRNESSKKWNEMKKKTKTNTNIWQPQ